MTYQLLNKRPENLPLAISHIAHLCNRFNHALIFIKIGLKLSYFCKKIQNFPDPRNSPFPLQISGYAPALYHNPPFWLSPNSMYKHPVSSAAVEGRLSLPNNFDRVLTECKPRDYRHLPWICDGSWPKFGRKLHQFRNFR